MKNLLYSALIALGSTLALLTVPAGAGAQPVCQVQHFSIHSGLSQRTVTAIVQDPKGYIWFSTWNGLNKFDGYGFTNYKAYPGDGCTLTSNRLSGLTATRQAGIWCQTYDGRVFHFDPRQERFDDLLAPVEQREGTTYTVRTIFALPKGVSWIVCREAAFRVDERQLEAGRTDSIVPLVPGTHGLPHGTLRHILQDAEGDEWLFATEGTRILGRKSLPTSQPFPSFCESGGRMYLITTEGRLAAFDYTDRQLRLIDTPYDDRQLSSLKSIGTDSIAFGVDRDLAIYLAREGTFRYFPLQANGRTDRVNRIVKDNHGALWLYTRAEGVTRLDPTTGEQQHFVTPREDLPQTDRVSRDLVFDDRQGTVWVVPHGGTLSYYDPQARRLCTYRTDPDMAGTRVSPLILNYLVDRQGNFWFANSFGMGRMSFFPQASRLTAFDSGFETRAFLADRQGRLWAANKRGYVRLFDADGQVVGYLTRDGRVSRAPERFGPSVYCFMQDSRGDIWMGSKWDGVFRLRARGNDRYTIAQYTHSDADPYSLSGNSVYAFCQDARGRVWVGSYGGGINLVDEGKDGRVRFIHPANAMKSYPIDRCAKVRVLHEVDSVMMVGTTEGLITFSLDFARPEEIRFHHHLHEADRATSLSANDVIYLYTDSRRDTYVLSFTGGLHRVDSPSLLTDSLMLRAYTKRDGLASDLVLSMTEDADGQLWLVSENFITRFDPGTERFENYGRKYFQGDPYFSEAAPAAFADRIVLGTDAGYISLDPGQLRRSDYRPPIVLTGIRIQGRPVEGDVDGVDTIALRPSERNLAVTFAALDYADPTNIRYAYRLKGLEEAWNEVDDSRRATYLNLPHGTYELQIRSTNSEGAGLDNTRSITIRVEPRFGETGWAVLLWVVAFLLLSGLVAYILVTIYRLRYRISIEQQLTQVKLRFFTDISHELRVPLTLIASPVAEVLEHEKLSDRARQYLTLVRRNTERMLRLVNQILDFRKIENKKMKLLLEETDAVALVERAMQPFRLTARERHIDYQLHAGPDRLSVWLDRDKVEKMVSNLLSNAFKYTPDGRAISVSVGISGEGLRIAVADRGIGIDREAQRKLFQRFESLVHRNILQPSSGIGLSLVRELTELHRGRIDVESEPGAGSTFTLTLPLDRHAYDGLKYVEFVMVDDENLMPAGEAAADGQDLDALDFAASDGQVLASPDLAVDNASDVVASTDASDAASPSTPAAGESIPDGQDERVCILVVEDNQELYGFLASILGGAGYRVVGATNGQEGLDCARREVPDLIISDVMMPVMDGLDMVRAIKRDREVCHIPIILLSAKSTLDDRIRGIEQGIDDYVTKPFSATYLRKRVKALLRQREQLQRAYLRRWTEERRAAEAATPAKPRLDMAEVNPSPPKAQPSLDEEFVRQVMDFVEHRLQDHEVSMDDFARHVNMGRSVFYHKLKAIFGLSPVEFLREMRLKRARQLVETGAYNVSAIATMTGFNDAKYFSKCYARRFGLPPSDHQRQLREANRAQRTTSTEPALPQDRA